MKCKACLEFSLQLSCQVVRIEGERFDVTKFGCMLPSSHPIFHADLNVFHCSFIDNFNRHALH